MNEKKNIIVFYSNTNTGGRHDATGAFIPEARAFQKAHNIPDDKMMGIQCPGITSRKRREKVLSAISEIGAKDPIDTIAFFGHGWPKGIQFGFQLAHIPELAQTIGSSARDDVNIVLYACLAAENEERDADYNNSGPATDGGFADLLRDEMVRSNIKNGWVDAHKTAGHTTWNPYVIRFLCSEVEDVERGATGGAWLVQPGSQLWKPWRNALRNAENGLRYRFPFMTEMEIKQQL